MITTIYNLYQNAKSCIKSNGKLFDYFLCDRCVRQGRNVSSILFAISLKDFEYYVSRKYGGLTDEIREYNMDDDVKMF